jgi:signal transduction histidine kinase
MTYVIIGWDSFIGKTENPYILAQQSAQLREIAHIYSHHINRWVANIQGLLPMIDRGQLNSESVRIFDMIQDAADQLRREIQLISKLAE